jgi:hypothetical protein
LAAHEEQDVYTVAARLTVDQSPAAALAVLADYEQILA